MPAAATMAPRAEPPPWSGLAPRPRIGWLRVGLAGLLLVTGYVVGRKLLRPELAPMPVMPEQVAVARSPPPSEQLPAPKPEPCPEGDVRRCDLRWLSTCADEARRTTHLLQLEPGHGSADLQPGENVILLSSGCQVRDGAVVATANIGEQTYVRLLGMARTDAKRASIRFHAIELRGRQYPICALGGEKGLWPGVDRVPRDQPGRAPDTSLRPGYAYVVAKALDVRVASSEWPPDGMF